MSIRTSLRRSLLGLFVAATTALAACGSQMDDLGDVVVRQTEVTPAGIYTGTLSAQLSTAPVPVVALVDNVDPKQHIVLYAADGSFLLSGLLTTVGTGVTAQTRFFDLSGSTTAPTGQTFSLSGSYVPQSQIGGQYMRMASDGSTLESGTLALNYQATEYETRSALALLGGNWANVDAFGTPQTSFSLDTSGNISGTVRATKCTYNGSATMIDLRYNLYGLSLTETCGSAPTVYTGLATLLPATAATNNQPQLVFAVGSTTAGLLFRLSPAS